MKYNIDKELNSLSMFRGAMVVHLYPFVNIVYRLNNCKSDSFVTVKKYSTPGYLGSERSTLVIEPKQCDENLPCLIIFHGGGFLLRASSVHYQFAKWYARKANCKVVLTDYRLLPQYKYPIAIEDCYNTYLWVLDNYKELNINKDKIIVTGDSAGGNIASAVIMMLRDRRQPTPKGAMLIYPVLDKRMSTESMKRYTDTPIWDSGCTKLFWDLYLENQDVSQVKYASISESDSLSFFPQTYVEVAEFDCLRDEGIAFAERLQSEGVSAEIHVVKGACHGFEATLKSTIVKTCLNRRVAWIKNIFQQ
ncbi:MAG: alpha/beta hydrolase [Christensenellales bacterium]